MLRGSLGLAAVTPRDSFSEDSQTKASLPQETEEGRLVNGPSPRGQKVRGHMEASSTRGVPAEGPGGRLPLRGPE